MLRGHEVQRRLHRCANCGRRIFLVRTGKYRTEGWLHYGYALRECDGLIARYATPTTDAS